MGEDRAGVWWAEGKVWGGGLVLGVGGELGLHGWGWVGVGVRVGSWCCW